MRKPRLRKRTKHDALVDEVCDIISSMSHRLKLGAEQSVCGHDYANAHIKKEQARILDTLYYVVLGLRMHESDTEHW